VNIQTLEYELPVSWQTSHDLLKGVADAQLSTGDLDLCGPADWEDEAEQRLCELAALPRGWSGPNSGPVSLAMVNYIWSVLNSIMDFETPLPSFVPAHGGAVQLEWHQNGLDVELMIYRPFDAELSVSYHDGRPPIEEAPMSVEFGQLSDVLTELG
jgi:hypothetical protein